MDHLPKSSSQKKPEGARTKRDIVRQIASELGITRKITGDIVQRTFDAILEAIVMDERVEFRNFGVFMVKKRLARKARNPQTGAEIDVPPKYVVTFKAGKELEARVRELMERDHPGYSGTNNENVTDIDLDKN